MTALQGLWLQEGSTKNAEIEPTFFIALLTGAAVFLENKGLFVGFPWFKMLVFRNAGIGYILFSIIHDGTPLIVVVIGLFDKIQRPIT